MSAAVSAEPFQVFGTGWAAQFDIEGYGPESVRWHVYRLASAVKRGDLEFANPIAFSVLDGPILSLSAGMARQIGQALIDSANLESEPKYDAREMGSGGPDKYEISITRDGKPERKTVYGHKVGDLLAVRRMNGESRWTIDHLPTGYGMFALDLFADARRAATEIIAMHTLGEVDLATTDPSSITEQAALREKILAIKQAAKESS